MSAGAAPGDHRHLRRWRLGVAAMLGAVVIYGTNFAISRYAFLTGLSPADLIALRFGTAGLLLLPVFVRKGVADCAGVGWVRGLLLTVMSGVPMTALMNVGLSLAPAAHAASIGPGTVTLIGAIGSVLLFGAVLSRAALAGLAVVIAGLACIGIAGSRTGAPGVLLGDLCFLATGLLWGFYPLLLQRWRIGAMTSTAIVAVLSLPYMAVYLVLLEPRLGAVDPWVIVLHAVNQGILNVIVGLWLWGHAVRVLGAATAQRFPPLIPVIGTLTAIPVAGEWPGPLQAAGVALIVAGLALSAFGGRLLGGR